MPRKALNSYVSLYIGNAALYILQQMEDDLRKSDSCGLVSERKKVLASSPGALACTFMDLGVFRSVGTHFSSEKVILPYFSSPSMVAVSVPFPEARNRKGTDSGLQCNSNVNN